MIKLKPKKYPLPSEFRKEWIQALKSKQYNKGKSFLYMSPKSTDSNKEEYCCIGVACSLLGVKNEHMEEVNIPYFIDKTFLPKNFPSILLEPYNNVSFIHTINHLNDGCHFETFDLIRSYTNIPIKYKYKNIDNEGRISLNFKDLSKVIEKNTYSDNIFNRIYYTILCIITKQN